MCSCSDNAPKAFTTVVRKAAKEHTCFECGRAIPKGDLYTVSSGVWDGGPESFKWCDTCTTIANLARGIVDGQPFSEGFCFSFGQLLECVQEDILAYHDDDQEAA